jgi:hypothetical protein
MAGFFDDVKGQNKDAIKAWLDQQVASGAISPAQAADSYAALGYVQNGMTTAPPGSAQGSQAVNLALGNGDSMKAPPNLALSGVDPATYKTLQMHLAALGLQAQRPMMEQSRVNALQNQLNAYKPMNSVLASMYGPGMTEDLQARSPLVPGQTSIGAPNQHDIGLQPPAQQPPGGQPQPSPLLRLLQGR